jgi:hypothetical protein
MSPYHNYNAYVLATPRIADAVSALTVEMLELAGCSTFEADGVLDAIDRYFAQGWTDGLPVVPPTREAVEAMVEAGHRSPEEVLGTIPQRDRQITCLQAATCAVMAGARPDYFPIILATWDAVLDPVFCANAALSSSGGAALTTVVSGDYGREVGMNSGRGLLGPGNRANATIGRAVRLGAILVLGARVGVLDGSSFSHGGKYTSHFLENDPPPPWRPLRVREGYGFGDTTVTVIPAEAPRQLHQSLNRTPEGMLRALAACMSDPTQNGSGKRTYYLIVLGPEHEAVLREGGVSEDEVCEYLASATRLTEADYNDAGILLDSDSFYHQVPDPDGRLTTAPPDHIWIATAGGPGAGWSAVIPCWTGGINTHPVTKPVRLPGDTSWSS